MIQKSIVRFLDPDTNDKVEMIFTYDTETKMLDFNPTIEQGDSQEDDEPRINLVLATAFIDAINEKAEEEEIVEHDVEKPVN